jgi:hypothetical protein
MDVLPQTAWLGEMRMAKSAGVVALVLFVLLTAPARA